jgi:DNA-binding NtrC family response regulator
MSGMDFLVKSPALAEVEVIMITAHGTIEYAFDAVEPVRSNSCRSPFSLPN